eukprot:CAMPEP_0170543352 /NCGR_PEP_ID=MMETSP0211-20121228/2490_1 /TAXON_ID=311385 /ORGANISM="Pseudokeronopsis sp., Strain OXSARD2" /LENGTH=110 /DNA_ID=CAMNT_0010846691 /DNA_START=1672 /DNA_END=2001 /DNA_ORIENTATION=+
MGVDLFELSDAGLLSLHALPHGQNEGEAERAGAAAVPKELTARAGVLIEDGIVDAVHDPIELSHVHDPFELGGVVLSAVRLAHAIDVGLPRRPQHHHVLVLLRDGTVEHA